MSVSMDSDKSHTPSASADEEEKGEDEELAHDDDKEDEDEINHTQLDKEVVHTPSPRRRVQKDPVWKHLKCISKHNVSDREIQEDCTHICVGAPRDRQHHGTHRQRSDISRGSMHIQRARTSRKENSKLVKHD